MAANRGAQRGRRSEPPSVGAAEYAALLRLERLDSLVEEMEELGVRTLDDAVREIGVLHRGMDEAAGPKPWLSLESPHEVAR